MSKIFMSYSREDVEFARFIADHLRKHNLEVLLDYQGLKEGENWTSLLEQQIQSSDGVVLLLSSNAALSKWVQDEITYAHQQNKLIVVLTMSEMTIPIRDQFFLLANAEHLDFTRWATGGNVGPELIKLLLALGVEMDTQTSNDSVESIYASRRVFYSVDNTLSFTLWGAPCSFRGEAGKDEYTFGRLASSDFIFLDRLVSRQHMRLFRQPHLPGWFLEDLGSQNGTYVNNRRVDVHEDIALQGNEIINLANAVYIQLEDPVAWNGSEEEEDISTSVPEPKG